MLRSFNKIARINLIILTICLITASTAKPLEENSGGLVLAKRSLLDREREFLKREPMSPDLVSLIEKFRRTKRDERSKRADDENQMFVIQDGAMVPFRDIKGYQHEDIKREDKSFTVLPLVIPIHSKSKPRPTEKPSLLKTRNLNEQLQQLINLSVKKVRELGNETANATNSDDDESSDADPQETAVLQKILEDIEGLMHAHHEGGKKEGCLCNLNGSWISEAAGMRFDICYQNTTRKKFRIHIGERIPPNEDGFMCDGNWSVFGELPFMHSGVVIVLAVHEKDKHIATFIGECRTCEGSETVTGTWMIGRSSRDCKDQKAAHKILSDVWRREETRALQRKHLETLGITVKDED